MARNGDIEEVDADVATPDVPEFLRDMVEEKALAEGPSTLVALGPTGTILWVNAAWHEFARANGGEELLTRFRPGLSYFGGIAPPLRSFYEDALQNAIVTGEPFEHEYECSSPEVFRLHHLRALPFGTAGLLVEHSLVVERPHEPEHEHAARYLNAQGFIRQCSNCRRVQRTSGDGWDWVRPWAAATPTNASHGICSSCIGYYWGPKLRTRT